MEGLVILFFLGLWVFLTIKAIKFGCECSDRIGGKIIGGFLGFMLLMGNCIVYWRVEYVVIKKRVTELCEKEGGLTVYVTPEEWRKQIGEEEWAQQYDDWHYISDDLTYTLNGIQYHGNTRLNKRVYSYTAYDPRPGDSIGDHNKIFVDNETGQLLMHERAFITGNSRDELKFWLDEIKDCGKDKWTKEERFYYDRYVNYEVSKEKRNDK